MQGIIKYGLFCGLLFVSSVVYAEGSQTIAGSMALSGLSERQQQEERGFFTPAENFTQLAAIPSYSFGAPPGMVPGWGCVFGGLGGTIDGVSKNHVDGGMSLGAGFGNPFTSVGGYAALDMGSVSFQDGGEFDRGQLAIGFGHNFRQLGGFGVSAGFVGLDLWHANKDSEFKDPSFYFAVSKILANNIAPVIITVGAGNNSFDSAHIAPSKRKYDIKEFGAIAVYVVPQVSVVADYTSGIVTSGLSISPLPKIPVLIGVAAQDIGTLAGHVHPLFTLNYGYNF